MKRLLLCISLFFLLLASNGQSLSDLRAQKTDAEKQIRYANSLLEESRKTEKSSLAKLKLLNSDIDYRNRMIDHINREIELVDWSIANNSQIISMLQTDLAGLKKEYAAMIRFAQKNRNSYDMLIFLFSADNMNQAYKRWIYLRQYARYRKSQGELIHLVTRELNDNLVKLESRKSLKTDLLNGKMAEFKALEQQRAEQNGLILSLQQEQKELKRQIREQQKIQDELNRRIEQMLEEEAKRTASTEGFQLTPEQKLVSTDFEKNKGRIPWPVHKGIITEHFGIHPHPILTQIQVRSNGIDITTDAGAKARAVFAGEVSRVFAISGGNMAVIIRHGSYLSVYSNLKEVIVKAGQKVALLQDIGTIYTDKADGNATVVKFQIWKENQKLDPEDWIAR